MKFQDMGLNSEILRAITEAGYESPTPIQQKSIPHALEGKDLIACAQTGTGKTAAFALPILNKLAASPKAPLRAVVLVPTRELAMQVNKNINDYAKYLDIESTAIFGGVPFESQEMMLRSGVDVLVATPGRLIDQMWRGNIDYRHTEALVLDEADRMLDMGFIDAVNQIVREIPDNRQSMLFSATLDPAIKRLSSGMLKDPVRVEVSPPASTVDLVEQVLIKVASDRKRSTLESLIDEYEMRRSIVFSKTKIGATRLAGHLRDRGYKAAAIHSDRSQSERTQTLENFRKGRVHILVATDIAARGIDIDDISHVINYDVPYSAEDYVHRIGRTARAGRKGMAITMATPQDKQSLRSIERLIGFSLEDGRPAEKSGSAPNGPARNSRGNGSSSNRNGSSRNGSRRRDNGRSESSGANGRSNRTGDRNRTGGRNRRRSPNREPEAVGVATAEYGSSEGGRSRSRRPRRNGESRNGSAQSERRGHTRSKPSATEATPDKMPSILRSMLNLFKRG